MNRPIVVSWCTTDRPGVVVAGPPFRHHPGQRNKWFDGSPARRSGLTAVIASAALGTSVGSVIPGPPVRFDVLGLSTMLGGDCRRGGPFLRPLTKIPTSRQLSHYQKFNYLPATLLGLPISLLAPRVG